jgi:hypothetical protein
MLRRNPDLLAMVAVALYLCVGATTPAVSWRPSFPHRAEVRQQIRGIIKSQVRAILRELALTIQQ